MTKSQWAFTEHVKDLMSREIVATSRKPLWLPRFAPLPTSRRPMPPEQGIFRSGECQASSGGARDGLRKVLLQRLSFIYLPGQGKCRRRAAGQNQTRVCTHLYSHYSTSTPGLRPTSHQATLKSDRIHAEAKFCRHHVNPSSNFRMLPVNDTPHGQDEIDSRNTETCHAIVMYACGNSGLRTERRSTLTSAQRREEPAGHQFGHVSCQEEKLVTGKPQHSRP